MPVHARPTHSPPRSRRASALTLFAALTASTLLPLACTSHHRRLAGFVEPSGTEPVFTDPARVDSPSPPAYAPPADDAATSTFVADWDDIDAAVDLALESAEFALSSWNDARAAERRMALRTSKDEPVSLLITRPDPAVSEATPMTVRVSVGRRDASGNPSDASTSRSGPAPGLERLRREQAERERVFLRALESRLRELKGRRWAPIN